MRGVVGIYIADMPEVLYALRSEMADALRRAAQDAEPNVAQKLHDIALDFEVGVVEGES